jgi:hypothetical protein
MQHKLKGDAMSDELKRFIDGKVDGEKLSIVNLDNGGAVELIDSAIADALANAADLNMQQAGKRVVIVKIEITPMDDNRSLVFVDYDVDVKLAKRIPISEGATYDIRIDGSKRVYAKSRIQQQSLFPDNTISYLGSVPMASKKGGGQ